VRVLDRTGASRVLDTAASIPARSLMLRGALLWTSNGQPRSATVG